MLIAKIAMMAQGECCADNVDGVFAASLLTYDAFVRSLRKIWSGRCMFTFVREVQTRPACLTQPERDVLFQVIEGYSNKTIARRLGITEAAFKVQLNRVLGKIRVDNRAQAAVWAVANCPELADPVEAEAAATPLFR